MFDSLVSMTWRDTLFLHWSVPPGRVGDRLPPGLELDTHEGEAWLGVVAFEMADIRPRGAPFGLSFGEVNLRTYVVGHDGTPGIYFFNLDADDPLGVAVARRLFRLAYYRAEMDIRRQGADVVFRSRRTHSGVPPARFDARYGPAPDAEPFVAEPGTLPHFLTERYRFYTESTAEPDRSATTLYYGDIAHEPWSLSAGRADVRANTLFAASGFAEPTDDPLVYYCPELPVRAGLVDRVVVGRDA
jgi:hypothetical protein